MSFDVFAFQVGDYLTAGPCIQDASCKYGNIFFVNFTPRQILLRIFSQGFRDWAIETNMIQMNQSKI